MRDLQLSSRLHCRQPKQMTSTETKQTKSQTNIAGWKELVERYQEPSAPRAVWQMINTLGPHALLWDLMYLSLTISWWLLIPLSIFAGGFLVRIFIIFHDCGHGSLFPFSPRQRYRRYLSPGLLTFHPLFIIGAGNMPSTMPVRAISTARHRRYLDVDGPGISRISRGNASPIGWREIHSSCS